MRTVHWHWHSRVGDCRALLHCGGPGGGPLITMLLGEGVRNEKLVLGRYVFLKWEWDAI